MYQVHFHETPKWIFKHSVLVETKFGFKKYLNIKPFLDIRLHDENRIEFCTFGEKQKKHNV